MVLVVPWWKQRFRLTETKKYPKSLLNNEDKGSNNFSIFKIIHSAHWKHLSGLKKGHLDPPKGFSSVLDFALDIEGAVSQGEERANQGSLILIQW